MGLLTGCWRDCSLQRGILGVRTITRSQSEENMNFQGDMVKCCLATEMCSEKCFIIVQTQCVLTQNNTGMMSAGENPTAPRCPCEAWPSSSLWVTALSIWGTEFCCCCCCLFLAWNSLQSSHLRFAEITSVFLTKNRNFNHRLYSLHCISLKL